MNHLQQIGGFWMLAKDWMIWVGDPLHQQVGV
jgi:hypothetical protein